MTGIHSEAEEVRRLYDCIEDQLSYVLKLLNEDHVVPFQLELAIAALERREHALHAHAELLSKVRTDHSLIPKELCNTILEEILKIEQSATMRAKVASALHKESVFFACLERIKGEVMQGVALNTKIIHHKNTRRVEASDDASDHKKE